MHESPAHNASAAVSNTMQKPWWASINSIAAYTLDEIIGNTVISCSSPFRCFPIEMFSASGLPVPFLSCQLLPSHCVNSFLQSGILDEGREADNPVSPREGKNRAPLVASRWAGCPPSLLMGRCKEGVVRKSNLPPRQSLPASGCTACTPTRRFDARPRWCPRLGLWLWPKGCGLPV